MHDGNSKLTINAGASSWPDMSDYASSIHTYADIGTGSGHGHGLYVQAGWNTSTTAEIARFSALGSGYVDIPRMVIQSGGNVGVGTTSPSAKLEVDGTTRITNLSGSGNRMVIADADGDLSTQAIPSSGISTASNGLTLSSSDVKLGGALTQTTTITQGSYDMKYNLNGTGDFIISDNGTEKFEFTDGGTTNFGGDVSWRDNSVTGTILMTLVDSDDDGRLRVFENGQTAVDLHANTGFVFNEQGNDRDFRVETEGNAHTLFIDAEKDKVGIKASSPGSDLQIGTSNQFKVWINEGSLGSPKYYHIGDINDNNGILNIQGALGGHTELQGRANVNITISVRDGFRVDGSVWGEVGTASNILVYDNSGLSKYQVYIKSDDYGLANLTLSAAAGAAVKYDGTFTTVVPPGTLEYDLDTDVGNTIRSDNDGDVVIGKTTGTGKLHVESATNRYSLYLKNTSTSNTTRYGIHNLVENTGTGSGESYGIKSRNTVSSSALGSNYGTRNELYSHGSGNRYGIYNYLSLSGHTGSGSIYGAYTQISSGSNATGNVYGHYISNSSYSSGTEYGIYTTGEDYNYHSGNLGIGTTSPDYKLDVTGDARIGWHGSSTRIKILPRDFIADDDNAYGAEYNETSNGLSVKDASDELYAFIPIPTGYKATHVKISGNSSDGITVYECQISSNSSDSKGSGSVNTELNITDVNSTSTNYLKIYVAVNSANDLIYGGYVTIAPIN